MKIKGSGRWALMLATGLFVCFAGPSHAAAGADADHTAASTKSENAIGVNKSAERGSPHWKSYADQLASADTSASNLKAMSARANEILQNAADKPGDAQRAAENQVVSADQLNDVDRALHEGPPTLTMAAADVPAAPIAPVNAASSSESSAWDQTSLIGKIFIGFGALLTMASAVRMFIA